MATKIGWHRDCCCCHTLLFATLGTHFCSRWRYFNQGHGGNTFCATIAKARLSTGHTHHFSVHNASCLCFIVHLICLNLSYFDEFRFVFRINTFTQKSDSFSPSSQKTLIVLTRQVVPQIQYKIQIQSNIYKFKVRVLHNDGAKICVSRNA